MADPIQLFHAAYALVGDHETLVVGDTVTIALRGGIAAEISATVTGFEMTDDGYVALLEDQTGCLWALPRPDPIQGGRVA